MFNTMPEVSDNQLTSVQKRKHDSIIPEQQLSETASIYKKLQTHGLPKVEALIHDMENVLGQLNKVRKNAMSGYVAARGIFRKMENIKWPFSARKINKF